MSAASRLPASGAVLKDCAECPELIVVPAGRILMGATGHGPDSSKSETPQHQINIAKAFAVGRAAVSFDEWHACVKTGGCAGRMPDDMGWGGGSRPVINISWHDAHLYTAWLSRVTNKHYRLLTEAEREYVARAGTTSVFWWGDSITTARANYDGNYALARGERGAYRQRTVSVMAFAPNPWNLFNVHGNVSEWVEDCWHDSYDGAPSDSGAWAEPGCTERVVRGGAWLDPPELLRAAARKPLKASSRRTTVGLRVARELE